MVGLIPLFAVEVLEPELLKKLPEFTARMEWYLKHRPRPGEPGFATGRYAAPANATCFRCCAAIA